MLAKPPAQAVAEIARSRWPSGLGAQTHQQLIRGGVGVDATGPHLQQEFLAGRSEEFRHHARARQRQKLLFAAPAAVARKLTTRGQMGAVRIQRLHDSRGSLAAACDG